MTEAEIRHAALYFLESHRKAVFSCVDTAGRPSATLMLYTVNEALEAHFGTSKSFSKYEQLQQNPHAAFGVIQEVLDPLQSVEIRGRVEFIPEEHTQATLQWFQEKNPSTLYVATFDDFVMFKVKPAYVRWQDATGDDLVMEHLSL